MESPVSEFKEDETTAGNAAREKGQSCCGACLWRVTGWIPAEYRRESLELVRLSAPTFISQLMVFLVSIVSMVFCGHLGKTELAGVSLAVAVVNVTGVSVGTGLSSTCDTLISQMYGSGNLKRVGVILQRGVLILLLACFPCWAVLINTEPLLLAVRQSPEVARLAQLYVKIFMPAVPASFMYQLQGKYLQNQGIMWSQVITGAIGNILNVVINYVFLHQLRLGVAGSAAANAISQYCLASLLCFYIWCRGLHKPTWGGWSLDCLQDWGPFIRLAIPSMMMICLSWWVFEVGGFLAGLISEEELGAQSIAYQLSVMAYMCPLSFSVAASVRVGNALGAGDIAQAKLSCKVPIFYGFSVACLVGLSVFISRNVIGYIFTSEPDILQRVGEVMLLFGFLHVCDATAGVAAGVLRGAGKQLLGALCNLVGFYFIGFPIGVALMFPAGLGIVGLWTGLTVCVALQAVVFIIFLGKLDWKKAAEEAAARTGVKALVDMKTTDSNQNEAVCAVIPSLRLDPEDGQTSPDSVVPELVLVPGSVLTLRQLVLRRGLALLVMVLILTAGVVTSYLLMALLKLPS